MFTFVLILCLHYSYRSFSLVKGCIVVALIGSYGILIFNLFFSIISADFFAVACGDHSCGLNFTNTYLQHTLIIFIPWSSYTFISQHNSFVSPSPTSSLVLLGLLYPCFLFSALYFAL